MCEHDFVFAEEIRPKVEVWYCFYCDEEQVRMIINPALGTWEICD